MSSNRADENLPRPEGLSSTDRVKLAFLRGAAALLRLGGFGGINLLARFGACCFWHFAPARREMAVRSIMDHLGKSRAEAASIARQSFAGSFESFLEILFARRFPLFDNPRLRPIPTYFRQMMEEERPVVAVLGHLGAWELLAGIMAQFRTKYPALVVVRSQKSRAMNEFMREMRSSDSSRAVGHRNAAREVTAALRAGGTAAFLVDHNALRQEAVFLPFLGETAAVNLGPALLALRAKAMVYPLCLRRIGKAEYEIVALEPLDTASLEGSIRERAGEIAAFYNRAMEELVRRYPEQWFWMHKRWKTKPKREAE